VILDNRPFDPANNVNFNYNRVGYVFEWKAHFLEWSHYFTVNWAYQSDSDFTTLHFKYGGDKSPAQLALGSFETGSLIDFRVSVDLWLNDEYTYVTGDYSEAITVIMPPVVEQGVFPPVSSSSPNTSSSSKPSSSDSNNSLYQQKSFPGIFIVVVVVLVFVCVIAILLAVIVYQRRQRRNRCGVGVVENVGCEVSSVE
jgi:hypothetical protein